MDILDYYIIMHFLVVISTIYLEMIIPKFRNDHIVIVTTDVNLWGGEKNKRYCSARKILSKCS
jgi:hypothetical protein